MTYVGAVAILLEGALAAPIMLESMFAAGWQPPIKHDRGCQGHRCDQVSVVQPSVTNR